MADNSSTSSFSFIKKLGIVLMLIVIMDLIIGGVLRTMYWKQQSGFEYKTTISLRKQKRISSFSAHRRPTGITMSP